VLVNGVKLTFYHFPYPIDFSQDFQGIVNLPDLLTLTAMKVFALGKRAKWKDYVDLYFLFKKLKFTKVLAHAEKLFGSEFNEKLLRVQLSYFKDIDYSEEVEFLPGFAVDPEQVEQFLVNLSVK
jgi:hypothetical protein